MKKYDVLISGVGGQGTILAGKIISTVALMEGLDVKTAETHGMAQRGGSVITHVRMGEKVYSPLITEGEADFIMAFEQLEALRYLPFLSPEGIVITNTQILEPLPVLTGQKEYPNGIIEQISSMTKGAIIIDALNTEPVKKNSRTINMLLTGALAPLLPFPISIWEQTINEIIPEKVRSINLEAFRLGLSLGKR